MKLRNVSKLLLYESPLHRRSFICEDPRHCLTACSRVDAGRGDSAHVVGIGALYSKQRVSREQYRRELAHWTSAVAREDEFGDPVGSVVTFAETLAAANGAEL